MKTKVNKSEKIRDYIDSHPSAGPKDVAEALKAKGIKVTAGHVSVIKHKLGSKKASKKATKAPKTPKVKAKTAATAVVAETVAEEAVHATNGHSRESLVEAIMQAESLVKYAGGLDKAKEFLDLISRL